MSAINNIRKAHVSPITISLLKQLVCFSIRIVQELFNGSISLHVCMHISHCSTIHHITNFIGLTFSQDKKKYLKARESIIADFFF